MAPWQCGSQQRPPSWTTRRHPPTTAWHPGSCFEGPSDGNPCPLGRARKPQLKWSNCHLLAGSSPWLQVNLLILPSPTPLVTGEDDEAWGTSIWPRNPQPRELQVRECWETVGLRTRLWIRPSPFSEDYTRPPGRPEQRPMLKGLPSTQEGREPGGHGRSPGRQEVQEAPASLQMESQALSSATGGDKPSDQPQDAGHCREAVMQSLRGPGEDWAPLSSGYREVTVLTQVPRPAGYQQPSLSARHSEASEAKVGGSSGKSQLGGSGKGVPAGVGQRATHTNSLSFAAVQAVTSPFQR